MNVWQPSWDLFASSMLNWLQPFQSIIAEFKIFYISKFGCFTYHQQQNKWYPQRFYVPISKLDSILAIPNLLVHNNLTKSYDVQVNSLRLKSSVASKWASKHVPLASPFILMLMVHKYPKIIPFDKYILSHNICQGVPVYP